MAQFNYTEMAELYPSRSFYKSRTVAYQRFDSAAEALRYAIEEMPRELLIGALLEVGEERYEHKQIKALYEAEDYPLERRTALS